MTIPRIIRCLFFMIFFYLGVILALAIHIQMWFVRQLLRESISGIRGKADLEMSNLVNTHPGFAFWVKWVAWSGQHFWH